MFLNVVVFLHEELIVFRRNVPCGADLERLKD
jgi:hypothetical protein